jgi:hypothetical protein
VPALTAALAEHQQHVQLQVDVAQLQVGQLGAAGAGVQQQHDDGGVAAGLEAPAGAGRRAGTIGTGRSGMIGGFIRAIGLGSSSSCSSQRYSTRRTL